MVTHDDAAEAAAHGGNNLPKGTPGSGAVGATTQQAADHMIKGTARPPAL